MIASAYIRYKEELPDGSNSYAAVDGFKTLGYNVVPFYGFGDAPSGDDLLSESVAAGTIGDVWTSLKSLNKEIPQPLDYPDHLRWALGREVYRSTLGDVKRSVNPLFVKPVTQKLFTGCVWSKSDRGTRLCLATYDDDVQVWASEPVKFLSEYRCFVMNETILGVKHYKGDWSLTPNRTCVETAVSSCRGKMPVAYSLDFGVDSRGWTLLVEANDAYALGNYGLNNVQYARMIEARWREMTK